MLWPPVPYSYDTINYDLPVPCPGPALGRELAGHRRPGAGRAGRIIYGVRISILFGLTLTVWAAPLSASVWVRSRAITAAVGHLVGQRFMEVWSGMPGSSFSSSWPVHGAAQLLVAAG